MELDVYKRRCSELEKENIRMKTLLESVKALLFDDKPNPANTPPHLAKTTAAVSPVFKHTARRWINFDTSDEAAKKPSPESRPETSKAVKVKPLLSSTNGTKPVKSEWLSSSRSKIPTTTAISKTKPMKRSSSYDRLPEENLPPYAFKGKAVRGAKRKALPGQSCNNCEEYYKCAGLEGSINKCSRHRALYPRVRTPKGAFDLDFPTTPELLARQAAQPSPDPQWCMTGK